MDPSSAVGVGSGGVVVGYADSVDSSPRSRGGESWDEPFPSSSPAPKLRLMCSYGGHIVPRPTDKSLCYLGGETRIVVVDRHSTLSDLCARLSRSLLGNRPFTLKYQLPNEDLDSLISVTTDEDLDNMIEEYDRLLHSNPNPSRSSRIRLFLFPSKPDSAPSSIGSLLDDSKSETWFVDALNNAIGVGGGLPRGLSADSASVNCLLGLEDDSSTHSRAGGAPPPDPDHLMLHRPDSSGRLPSVPDSPMLETTSSFGSASSAPSLSNLPPIRVRPEDRPPDPRIVGLDDHFSQMNISNPPPQQPPPPQPSFPLTSTTVSPPTISPTENPNRVFSDDERSEKSDHSGVRKAPPPQVHQHPQVQQTSIPESMPRTMYAANPVAEAKRDVPISDQNYRIPPPQQPLPPQQIQASEQSYIMQSIPTDHQQQFITAGNHHYFHHPATGTAVPIQSYYHVSPSLQQSQQPHHFDPQISMYQYYVPVRQNPGPPLTNPPIPASRPIPSATAASRSPIVPTGMGYHMVPQQAPAMANYAAYDPSMYYTQTSAPPPQMLQAQYQQVSLAETQSPPADARPTRAS